MKQALELALFAALALGCSEAEKPAAPSAPKTGERPAAPKRITIAMMPKLVPIPYFQACEKGAREAAQELGDKIQFIYDGPATDSDEKQQQILDTWIAKRYEVLAVAPVNPESISNRLKKALDRKLHVVTYDADAASAREFFINQGTYEDIARTLVDLMAEGIGGKGQVAIISGSRTAANQREWMKRMLPYMAERHPDMKMVEDFYPGEDHAEAVKDAQRALQKYPDLKGIFGITSVSCPASAEAVRQAKAADRVCVTGLATPNDMREYINDGTVRKFALWNAVDLGYLTVHAGYLLAQGKLPKDGEIEAGRLGKIQVKAGEVLLGPPVVFSKENIDKFNF
jgi:ABC-type sugar transport system substrate-binding protein